MNAQANAVAVISEQPSEQQLDEFGRDAAERTVELQPRDAEAIDVEVVAGKHQTYDDALAYVISRGLAEIKRQRDAANALRAKAVLQKTRDTYQNMLKLNPSLVTDANFVSKMLADLDVIKSK